MLKQFLDLPNAVALQDSARVEVAQVGLPLSPGDTAGNWAGVGGFRV